MSVAITTTPASTQPGEPQTISITGLSAATNYTVSILDADGHTQNRKGTSDGAGSLSLTWVPKVRGNSTIAVRPTAEFTGTTAAAATGTARSH